MMQLRTKVIAIAKTAILAGSFLAGQAFAADLEKTNVSIGISPDFSTSAHAVIAQDQGYFEEAGLDVKLETFPAGVVQLEAMAAGNLDFAIPAQQPVVALRANGVPVVVLSSVGTARDNFNLAVRSELGATTPTDLIGLKIGLMRGTTAELMMNNIMAHYDLTEGAVEVVNLRPPEQITALGSGAIDGILVWEPWFSNAAGQNDLDIMHTGGRSMFAGNKGEEVVVDVTRVVLTTTEPLIAEAPNTINAVVAAMARADAYLADEANFEKANRIVSEYHGQDPANTKGFNQNWHMSMELSDAYLVDMEAAGIFLRETGRIREIPEIASFTYGAPLAGASEGSVSIDTKWMP
jgi:ABC-type nitrate/sulfonate/bicarbonate transport system substrate-binding protein